MTTAAMTGATSPPRAAAAAGAVVAGALLQAQLDLATEWRFWCVLQHRDGRVFAGRAGDFRIFGTTMVRLDVPTEPAATTYAFNAAAVDDILVASEAEVRQAAALLGDRDVLIDVVGWVLEQGRAAEGDDERR